MSSDFEDGILRRDPEEGGGLVKGLAGRQTRGLPKGARLECIDNTGAKIVEIVEVPKYHGTHRRYSAAGVGDLLLVSVKKGTPEMRKTLVNAVIVRQRRPFRRSDGIMVSFDDNACVVVTPEGEVKGSDIKGPVAREAAERWPRIAATASIIV
jgi:large subunit ribosomal protein L14